MTHRLRALFAVVVALVWLALLRVTTAFVRSELDWRIVAETSRTDAPWYYRLAAVWGGLAGSLLLFAALVGAALLVGLRRSRSPLALAAASATVAVLAAVDVALLHPFDRLKVPATGGFGLTPILEHPAMAVHPPVLYAGLAATAVPFYRSLGGDAAPARPWLRTALAAVTAAMALGAAWSYVEQGWGGYWAWDPVENTSLLVWLAVLVAVHVPVDRAGRVASAAAMAPWVLALAGACLVRSGATPSIHGFGQRAAVGWCLLLVALAHVALAVWNVRRRGGEILADPAGSGWLGRAPLRWLAVVLAAVVLAGTVAPVLADAVADRPAAVRGTFFAAFAGPVALAAVPFLVLRVRRVGARGFLAHAGALVLLAGIAASTLDRVETVIIPPGATVAAAGRLVTNHRVIVVPGPRAHSDAVVAVIDVDGHEMRPRRVAFRDRGGQLAENAVRSRPWRDVQVQLDTANDAGVVTVTVYSRPLMWLVWLGATAIAAGAVTPAWRRRAVRRRTGDRACAPAAR